MTVSIFDIFSIGVGPSSSHTTGPMRAAYKFLKTAKEKKTFENIFSVKVQLYGSLAMTGKGHLTDKAVLLGLEGFLPETVDPEKIEEIVSTIEKTASINLLGEKKVNFEPEKNLIFAKGKVLPLHPNAMTICAYDRNDQKIDYNTYYSIGGGFIIDHKTAKNPHSFKRSDVRYPFKSARELLYFCKRENKKIHEIMLENEKSLRSVKEIEKGILEIWKVMEKSIQKGCATKGVLPGSLKVKRRAYDLHQKLLKNNNPNDPHMLLDWVSLYALAVKEENASGSQVVTAPTNGAAGIIPATIAYLKDFHPAFSDELVIRYLLTAGAIANLYKEGASISGAEMGCQGEVGVACSMAAAGLAEAFNGTNEQIECAAEIGMEHNLGLTCDPVDGLVQIPCIERNTMGAIKAINASRLAMQGDGSQKVSLDQVIAAMKEIGNDMKTIYKETSEGGLAKQLSQDKNKLSKYKESLSEMISVGTTAC